MKRLAILLAIAVLAVAVPVSSAPPPLQLNLNVSTFTLQNGMLFLVVERPGLPQAACRVAIRAGSALEQAGQTGIAHMLEHMMFKGTRNFGTLDAEKDQRWQEQIEAAYQVILSEKQRRNPDAALIRRKRSEMEKLRRKVQKIYVPQAFSAQLGKNGAVGVNAFTTQDQTQYLVSVPSDMLEQWFSIVSEQLFEPAWREFYVEKEVVQREWAFRYVNNPNGAAWLDLYATAYTAHPYRNPVIGWRADMENFNTRDAAAFHRAYYHPRNAVAVLVGDVTTAEARRLADIYFGRYPSRAPAPEKVTAEPPQNGPRRSIRFLKGARTPLVRIAFHGADMGTPDFYALDALTMVLSHGRGSRMRQNIVNTGAATDAWAYNPDNRYGGLVILGGSPNEPPAGNSDRPSAYPAACEHLEAILLDEVRQLQEAPVTARELKRIQKLSQRHLLDRLHSNEDLAETLATLEVQIGWRYLDDYLTRIAGITADDIQRAAQKYLQPEKASTVFVIPGGETGRPPAGYAEERSLGTAAADRISPPADCRQNHSDYPTPPGWRHPLCFSRRPEKIDYPAAQTAEMAGAKIFFRRDPELPLIHLKLLIKAGAVDINPRLAGLDQVLNSVMVRGGTRSLPPRELALQLDENAIDLSVSVREEETRVSLSVMKPDWPEGLRLLAEILLEPGFDPEVLAAAKAQALTALQRQGEDAMSVAMREGEILHFKGHPYGRDPLLGLETIPTITAADLKAFVDRHFVPANMSVAVAGDIQKTALLEDLAEFFDRFKLAHLEKETAPPRNLPPPPPAAPALVLIQKPGQVQAQVNLRLRSLPRSHPDFWKVHLLADLFGGSDSLLSRRLRDDLGLVYSAWFYQGYKWKAGFLNGYIGCQSSQTRPAIEQTLAIMKGLQQRVPAERFELKRLDALNSFVFNVDTAEQLTEVYARYWLRQEPLDTLDRIQRSFLNATAAELERLARGLFTPEHLQIVVVADPNTPVNAPDAPARSLSQDLQALANELGLPFEMRRLR